MTGIVLVTHDGLGQSLRQQAESILGRDVGLTTIAIGHDADPDTTLTELIGALAGNADGDGVLVLTDLPGATPHNLACQAARQQHFPVVSGLNLPMLLKVINHADQPPAELAESACRGGREGVAAT